MAGVKQTSSGEGNAKSKPNETASFFCAGIPFRGMFPIGCGHGPDFCGVDGTRSFSPEPLPLPGPTLRG